MLSVSIDNHMNGIDCVCKSSSIIGYKGKIAVAGTCSRVMAAPISSSLPLRCIVAVGNSLQQHTEPLQELHCQRQSKLIFALHAPADSPPTRHSPWTKNLHRANRPEKKFSQAKAKQVIWPCTVCRSHTYSSEGGKGRQRLHFFSSDWIIQKTSVGRTRRQRRQRLLDN